MSDNDDNDNNDGFPLSHSNVSQTQSENSTIIKNPSSPIEFTSINIRKLMKSVKKENNRNLKKQIMQISFKKSVLKKVSKNTALHLNQYEICILVNFITLSDNPIGLLPEGGRSSLQSLKLFLQTVHNRMKVVDKIRSLPDLVFLVCKDIQKDKFEEFKKSSDFKNYEKVRDFNCHEYLDKLTDKQNGLNGVDDGDDDDDDVDNNIIIKHSQDEIDNEEDDNEVHRQYQGITYNIKTLPNSASHQDADSLLELINSQNSMEIDEIDEKQLEVINFDNFMESLRREYHIFQTRNSNQQIKKANILTGLVSNLILFGFDVNKPNQNPILNYVCYFLNLHDSYQALKWVGNAKTSITEKLFKSKVIDSNDKVINLKKYKVMLDGTEIPSFLLSKYSTLSGNTRKSSTLSPPSSPKSSIRPHKKAKFTHGFQFPSFKSPLSHKPSKSSIIPSIPTLTISPPSSPTPNGKPVTFQDLQKFKNDINITIQQSHHSLKKKLDKVNYTKNPPFTFDPTQSNIQQLVTVNANNISALAVDKPKKLDAIVTMVSISKQKFQNPDMQQITKLLNSRLDDDGKKISNSDIVSELEGKQIMNFYLSFIFIMKFFFVYLLCLNL